MIKTMIRGACQAIWGEFKKYRRTRWRKMPAMVASAMLFGFVHMASMLGLSPLRPGPGIPLTAQTKPTRMVPDFTVFECNERHGPR
jgi:hypothetical protein